MFSFVFCSRTTPSFITMTRSHICRITARSWLTKSKVREKFCCKSLSKFKILAWTDTSREDVGSSQKIKSGRKASARAIPIRCRCPPEKAWGNLFKPDEQLEALIIDDHIIKDDLSHLSAYNFSDDIDVEVLGHIFEQSLNDLEKIKESLFTEHKIVNTRKKDGVFYTPKFITEYIINNTIAKLCEEKKELLKLFTDAKETKKAKETRRKDLHKYREYLEGLKIVDPACGSGAFLTASFRYLLNQHRWIQNELGKYEAGLFDYHNMDKQIIENNLFGVDINGASVGIAKLSLWLQTAKRDRPLSNLMGNIKSANSLTTNWHELFPDIMANGGFDCVIGNPPYGASFSKDDKNNYHVHSQNIISKEDKEKIAKALLKRELSRKINLDKENKEKLIEDIKTLLVLRIRQEYFL